jgi:phenylalanyl-tRNA synthetase beta chain
MRHGVFTDALTRFNKGQSPLQNQAVIKLLAQSIIDVAGGTVASALLDDNHVEGRQWVHPPVPVALSFINSRLGLSLDAPYVRQLLERVEFGVQQSEVDLLTITAPFWRTDIETRDDVVEEVGRLHGFDKLPLELPQRSVRPVPKNKLFELRTQLRDTLARSGANEVLTYSFVHGNLLDRVGQDVSKAFRVSNALSPDLQYFRLGLTPSLLEKVHPNIKAGDDSFALFELGKSHFVGEWDEQDSGVPNEDEHLAVVVSANDKARGPGGAYYLARKYLETISPELVHQLVPMTDFDFTTDEWGRQLTAPYEPKRSAIIVHDGTVWGVVGEFRETVKRTLKLPEYTAGFELHLDAIPTRAPAYLSFSKFPKVSQDLTLRVAADTSYEELTGVLQAALDEHKPKHSSLGLRPLSIYRSDEDRDHTQLSYRLSIASNDKTLTDAEVASLLEKVAKAAVDKLHAQVV